MTVQPSAPPCNVGVFQSEPRAFRARPHADSRTRRAPRTATSGRAKEISARYTLPQRTMAEECRQFAVEKGSDYWIFVLGAILSFHGWASSWLLAE